LHRKLRISETTTTATTSTGSAWALELVRSVVGRHLATPWSAVSADCKFVVAACRTDFERKILAPGLPNWRLVGHRRSGVSGLRLDG